MTQRNPLRQLATIPATTSVHIGMLALQRAGTGIPMIGGAMTGEEAIARLCALTNKVNEAQFHFEVEADCFCGKNPSATRPMTNDSVIEFIEQATYYALGGIRPVCTNTIAHWGSDVADDTAPTYEWWDIGTMIRELGER